MLDRFDTSSTEPRSARGWASGLRRRFVRSYFAVEALSWTATAYLSLVRATGRLIIEGDTLETRFTRDAPLIATTWHSEAFLLPALRPPNRSIDVMVSRANDGEVFSHTLRSFGFGIVRGSGSTDPTRIHEKGSVAGFRSLMTSLKNGRNVFLTADFDARTRGTVSPGVIALARLSQRPIVPVIAVASNHTRLGSWDRTALGLPFSRIVAMTGDPIVVPRHATERDLEELRLAVEGALTALTERAYAIAGRRRG